MGIKRALPRYCCQIYVIARELSLFAFHNQRTPFCPYPLDTVCNLTLDTTQHARHPPAERSRMMTVPKPPKTGEE